MKYGYVERPASGPLRYSSAVRKLRKDGHESAAADVEALKGRVGSTCPVHGALEDPMLFISGTNIVFGCPDCSDPEIREAWEKEGAS